MPADSAGRQELARFLRTRRRRVTPEQVGLPVGPRRRVSGLRREEVAILAGLSPTWYTYLEQGRDIRPSPEVLNSLAVVLKLTEDERRYMHVLVYGQVVSPRPLDEEVSAAELLRQFAACFQDSPYPMYATNQYCDLLAWNPAATDWYDDWSRMAPGECNIMRWMLTSGRARERMVDWEIDTRDAVSRWRAEAGRWQDDERLIKLVAEFARLSPEFARWWDEHDVREHRSGLRRLKHPVLGVRALRIVPMRSPEIEPAGIVFHLPADGSPRVPSGR